MRGWLKKVAVFSYPRLVPPPQYLLCRSAQSVLWLEIGGDFCGRGGYPGVAKAAAVFTHPRVVLMQKKTKTAIHGKASIDISGNSDYSSFLCFTLQSFLANPFVRSTMLSASIVFIAPCSSDLICFTPQSFLANPFVRFTMF